MALNSCTGALHLSLAVLGLQSGDEVIVPTYTFAATAEVVHYLGARPVLVDVDPVTANIDPEAMRRAITPRTKAVIPVHFAGQACEMDAILDLAHEHGLAVVEDAAHALPTCYRGKLVGTLSPLTCFSFYATKNLATGEGGMLTTDNAQYADKARSMSLHGLSRDAWQRYSEQGSWFYEITQPGYKYNMTDIAAALGLQQLRKLPILHGRRRGYAQRYTEAFSDLSEVVVPPCHAPENHAWHLFVIRLNLGLLRCTRADFIKALEAENIGCSVHFIPLHMHPYYRDTFGYQPQDLPVAKQLYEEAVSLPLYPAMSANDVDDVIRAVHKVVAHYRC